MSFIFRRLFSSTPSAANMAVTKQQVQSIIDENKVVVFSKSYCPYCRQTKSTLDELNADYKVIELDQISEGSEFQDVLEQISGQRTVPNSYINQKHIGGNSDIQGLLKGNKLENLLKEANALKA
ncbi:glutaredoxin [Colletotrichum karsti]|uniref:Glutaredoxin n=1 Tax=Colletotrichum karsti TaxID=1095194 RepID=A0A9P6LCV6_9PEZI|nr:glutaredoxin [Colletotrichum karsti]KAF9869834.1 glutaredoxin [Colletotrichum karsti]